MADSNSLLGISTRSNQYSVFVSDGATGHGSTGTAIRYFGSSAAAGSIREYTGNAITYVQDSIMGDSWRLNENGIYSISYTDTVSSGSSIIGLSVNSTALTTSVASIASKERLSTVLVASNPSEVSITRPFKAGDIIRAHTDGTPDGSSNATRFTICKVA